MDFTDAGGKSPCRWVAIHHGQFQKGNDHLHIAASMVREDVQKVVVALEQLCEGDVEAGVLPRFRHVVSAQPDAVAVADDNEELTYTQVAAAAARVLNEIQLTVAALEPSVVTAGEEAFGAKEPIATLYGHTPHAATALLGGDTRE